jgi:hypothetical protein
MIGQYPPIRRLGAIAALTLFLGGGIVSFPLLALQRDAVEQETLRDRVRQRFEIIARQNGLALIPKEGIRDVLIIEIVDGAISINNQAVTGRELRDRLREDADLVLQVSYLDERGRRNLLASTESATPPPAGGLPGLGPPGAPPTPEPPSRRRPRFPGPPDRRNSGDIVRFGGNATVRPDEVVFGDVVVIGGRSDIDGEVRGNVVTIGGAMRLGPRADVRGDAVAIWSRLDRAEGAQVGGEYVDIGAGNWIGPRGPWHGGFPGPFPQFPNFVGLVGTLLRLGLLMMLGWLFVAVGRGPVQRIADRAAAEPVKAGLVGVLAEVLFLPILVVVIVLLAISIIGIPLLALVPLAILGLVLVLIAGFTAMALRTGQWIGGLGSNRPDAYTSVAIGTIVLLSFAVMAKLAFLAGGIVAGLGIALGVIGFCVEYLVWTVGLGAAVLVRLAPRSQPTDMLAAP